MTSSLTKSLTKALPRPLKIWLKTQLKSRTFLLPEGRRALVFLAADYGNIGDLAITRAQESFLASFGSELAVVLVPISQTRFVLRSIQSQICESDLITIIGGGNMGSLYPDIEQLRQLVIRSFPRNRIICFPQTLDWDDTNVSKRALKNIVRTYSRHSDNHVFARESTSYDKLKELFRCHSNVKIGYAPDIVLSATAVALGCTPQPEPSGVLLCLRDDRESALRPEDKVQLDEVLRSTGEGVEYTDTHAGGSSLDEQSCSRLLADKLNQFRVARLVVTDRLHGMIFAAHVGTPCLVLPNSNHKIRQTWMDWLADVPQVRFLSLAEFHQMKTVVEELLVTPRGDPASNVVKPHHFGALRAALQQ